jgi:flagellar biosynthesis/type III secretory pathway M-ring protein FliF/YscJ
MMGFLKIILFFILFMIIIKFVRLISRFRSSTKQTIDDLKNKQREESIHFDDVEEADFREIDFDNEKESEDNKI